MPSGENMTFASDRKICLRCKHLTYGKSGICKWCTNTIVLEWKAMHAGELISQFTPKI